jgi:hypothetical protein
LGDSLGQRFPALVPKLLQPWIQIVSTETVPGGYGAGLGTILDDSPDSHPTQFSQCVMFQGPSIVLHLEAR